MECWVGQLVVVVVVVVRLPAVHHQRDEKSSVLGQHVLTSDLTVPLTSRKSQLGGAVPLGFLQRFFCKLANVFFCVESHVNIQGVDHTEERDQEGVPG